MQFLIAIIPDLESLRITAFEHDSTVEDKKSIAEPHYSDISDVPLNLTMPRLEPKSSVPEVVVSFHDSVLVPPLNLTSDDETDHVEKEFGKKC